MQNESHLREIKKRKKHLGLTFRWQRGNWSYVAFSLLQESLVSTEEGSLVSAKEKIRLQINFRLNGIYVWKISKKFLSMDKVGMIFHRLFSTRENKCKLNKDKLEHRCSLKSGLYSCHQLNWERAVWGYHQIMNWYLQQKMALSAPDCSLN